MAFHVERRPDFLLYQSGLRPVSNYTAELDKEKKREADRPVAEAESREREKLQGARAPGSMGPRPKEGRIKGHRLRVQGTGGLSAPPRESGGPVNRRRFGRGSGSTRRRAPGPFGHPQAEGRHLDRLAAAPEGARSRRPEEFKGARGKGTSCVWKRVKE
jgi:hypothetical protein